MIIELEKYQKDEKISVVVSEIIGVEIYKDYRGTGQSDKHYDLVIRVRQNDIRVSYLTDLARCQLAYDKVKHALELFHQKDSIGAALQEYLKTLKP